MPTSEPHFPARFDADIFDEDTAHSTRAGRTAAEAARRDYERDGVPRLRLKPCEAEGRDGTNLLDCAKVYVPHPDGRWGIVFKVIVNDGRPRLDFVAFGVRHHPRESNALDVYDIAHLRLAADDTEKPDT